MKFKSHIPKPKLSLRSLLLLAITWLTAIPILLANPLIANAEGSEFTAGEVSSFISANYNGTSSSSQGGNSHIVNGVSYTRTGYLCYLLTKDGSTTGDPAYAFYSPGYNGIAGSRWVCTSRRGHSVSSWRGDAPWGVTPWENGGSPSNEPKIREWALQPIDGFPQAKVFVKDIWGLEAAKNFESDEYILVIETIMNFQYSVDDGSGGGDTGIVYISRKSIESQAAGKADMIMRNLSANLTPSQREEVRTRILLSLTKSLTNQLGKYPNIKIGDPPSGGGNTGRTFTSDPLIGTVPNLIKYKNGAKVFDSYTNKVAPHAEKIKVSEAGFTSYPSSGPAQLTDAEVEAYGVAMLIIHCKNDAIHTYWPENGSPGKPESRLPGKTGTCNIVKGYYKENLTTGAKESLGVYHELEVTSNIIVSGEPEFELVEYYCLTAI